MCEEVRNHDGVAEWEAGLPSSDDLAPLSQALVPANLASAFKISPEEPRTMFDVNLASDNTLSSLRDGSGVFTRKAVGNQEEDQVMEVDSDEIEEGSDAKKCRRMDAAGNCAEDQSPEGKTTKRPRLVWTPQLHRRFVEVVAHLGLKNAVPKTIMQMMNVEGLTRENVASHLQKYRLYVKRMQGLSNDDPSPSDVLFASTPVPPQSFKEASSNGNHGGAENGNENNWNNHMRIPIPMPYHHPQPPMIRIPVPMMGMVTQGMDSAGGFNAYEAAVQSQHHRFQQQCQYNNNMIHPQGDWSGNNYK